jgi:hypothetical protein
MTGSSDASLHGVVHDGVPPLGPLPMESLAATEEAHPLRVMQPVPLLGGRRLPSEDGSRLSRLATPPRSRPPNP